MLKITRTERDGTIPSIKLEGKLLAPWVEEVAGLFSMPDDEFPRLDLVDLTFVDTAGSQLLQELMSRGVQIESCAPYVAQLLHWDPNSNH